MNFCSPPALGALYGCSEAVLAIMRRSNSGSNSQDRGSLQLLWIVIMVSVAAGFWSAATINGAAFNVSPAVYRCFVGLFFAGLAWRAYSIAYLGRYFTVNVAISDGHQVVDRGPYRFIRHPSYTGSLLAFLALALCLKNLAAWLVMMLPITAAFLHRIRIEEAVLCAALGENYRRYMRHTKRLIPGIY